MAHPLRDQIKNLWPDKALYGAIILFLAGFLGIIHGSLAALGALEVSTQRFRLINDLPAYWPLAFSLITFTAAYLSLHLRSWTWGVVGSIAAVVSTGLVILVPLLGLVALAFLVASKLEHEDTNPDTKRLTPNMWPDKALGASLVLLTGGLITTGWWIGLVTGFLTAESYLTVLPPMAFVGVLLAACAFYGSWQLYHLKGPRWGYIGGIALIIAFGAWALGPLLGLTAIWLVHLASKESEFLNPNATGGRVQV